MRREALISPCEKYRYWLLRGWDPALPAVLWVMLNPSTADATKDDATIRRCIKFSRRWGFGTMIVANLFAYRATDPKELHRVGLVESVGPDNWTWLRSCAALTDKGIIAWGNGGYYPRPDIPPHQGGWWHLGKTKSGEPLHPLARGKAFIPYDRPLTAIDPKNTFSQEYTHGNHTHSFPVR